MKPVRAFAWLLPIGLSGLAFWWLATGGSRSAGGADLMPKVNAEAEGFPREVELFDGTRLTLEGPPQRVVAANSGAVDLLSELLPPGRLVAMPEQAFRYSRLAESPGAFGELPTFGRYHAEPILGLEPDLVLCDPWGAADTTARLREAGIDVLLVPATTSFDDVLRTVELLGTLLAVEEEAALLNRSLRGRVERLDREAGARRGLRAMTYSYYGSKGSSSGLGTSLDTILSLAGLVNATAEAERQGVVSVSFEDLIVWDPDVIVVSDLVSGEEGGGTRAFLRGEPALEGLRAVKSDRLVSLPPRLFATNSQEMVTAAEELARRLDALLAAERPEASEG